MELRESDLELVSHHMGQSFNAHDTYSRIHQDVTELARLGVALVKAGAADLDVDGNGAYF